MKVFLYVSCDISYVKGTQEDNIRGGFEVSLPFLLTGSSFSSYEVLVSKDDCRSSSSPPILLSLRSSAGLLFRSIIRHNLIKKVLSYAEVLKMVGRH